MGFKFSPKSEATTWSSRMRSHLWKHINMSIYFTKIFTVSITRIATTTKLGNDYCFLSLQESCSITLSGNQHQQQHRGHPEVVCPYHEGQCMFLERGTYREEVQTSSSGRVNWMWVLSTSTVVFTTNPWEQAPILTPFLLHVSFQIILSAVPLCDRC